MDYTERLAEYEKQWPNYCKTCNASGEQRSTENASPHGSGLSWPMDTVDICEDCAASEKPKCPRCGGNWYMRFLNDAMNGYLVEGGSLTAAADELYNTWLDEQKPCWLCGWTWDGPDVPQC